MNWTTIRRASSLIEHVCECAVGHPNYYSVARLHQMCAEPDYNHGFAECSWWIHGCDGCCARTDFPGSRKLDQQLVGRLEEKIDDYWHEDIDIQELMDWCAYTIHDLMVNERIHR